MSLASDWRTKSQRLNLIGEVCPHCGAKLFPPRDICPECGGPVRRLIGTGGAVKFVAQKYDLGWSFVCNGDTLCPADLNDVKEIGECKAAILVSKKDDVTDYGSVLTDENDGITAFVEKGKNSGEGWVNAGMYLIDLNWAKSWNNKIPLSNETDVFPALSPDELKVWRTNVPFLDIGVPVRLEKAAEFLRNMDNIREYNPN